MTESPTWLEEFGVKSGSSEQSNVVSMFQLGNIPGSLLAFFLADNFGRLRTVQICSLLWILGTAVWITSSPSLNQTLAGRFVAGELNCPSLRLKLYANHLPLQVSVSVASLSFAQLSLPRLHQEPFVVLQ